MSAEAKVSEEAKPSEQSNEQVSRLPSSRQLQDIPIERIDPSPYQVRQTFDESSLRELADSMK